MTSTIETSKAEKRKEKAAEFVEKLEKEQVQLQTRKQKAAADVERLHGEIAAGERTGAAPKTLAALRKARAEQEQVSPDLDRVLPTIERDLVAARVQLHVATIAVHMERYNALVEKQRSLADVLDEAVQTIVETLKVKEGLAQKQTDIQNGDVACPYPSLSPIGIRWALAGVITKRLEMDMDKVPPPFPPPFSRIDWSCRNMNTGGSLEE